MTTRTTAIAAITLLVAVLAASCSSGDDAVTGTNGAGALRLVIAPGAVTNALEGSIAADSLNDGSGGGVTTTGDDHGDHDGDLRDRLQAINVTFSDIQARDVDSQQLVRLDVDLPTTVDLLPVLKGESVELPTGTLSPGTYDQLVVIATSVEFVTQEDTRIAITPADGRTRIVMVEPFTVEEGAVTEIVLKLRLDSFRFMGDDRYEGKPEMYCDR